MRSALVPGSYDPITLGHLDVIRRAAQMFDRVTVLVAHNNAKNYLLCSQKRLALAEVPLRISQAYLPKAMTACSLIISRRTTARFL